jgi:hypothetical protein
VVMKGAVRKQGAPSPARVCLPVHAHSRANVLHEPSQRWPQAHHHQCKAHQADGKRKEQGREERIVEEKDASLQFRDHPSYPCRPREREGSRCVVDDEHIAIAGITIASSIVCGENGRGKWPNGLLHDQPRFF